MYKGTCTRIDTHACVQEHNFSWVLWTTKEFIALLNVSFTDPKTGQLVSNTRTCTCTCSHAHTIIYKRITAAKEFIALLNISFIDPNTGQLVSKQLHLCIHIHMKCTHAIECITPFLRVSCNNITSLHTPPLHRGDSSDSHFCVSLMSTYFTLFLSDGLRACVCAVRSRFFSFLFSFFDTQ